MIVRDLVIVGAGPAGVGIAYRLRHSGLDVVVLEGDSQCGWPYAQRATTRRVRGRGVTRPLPRTGREVGIDLGLSSFAALSDGRKLDNPRFARQAQRKLARAQRALARTQKGSKNRAKARARVARCHARVRDTRRDWLHQQSTRIIRDNQAVYVEDLAVSGLARTRMARSVHDAGWSAFVGMLAYKAVRYGRTFGKVERWFPSTRRCSTRGAIGDKLPLHVREWSCPCGAVHDRDVNAAINILAAGRADRPTPVELMSAGTPVPQSAGKQEPAGSAA